MASTPPTRIAFLDGWRGIAILTVLLGHFGPFGATWGTFGVELFFVLSGRLMAQILFEKRVPLPEFFRRRFSRIYPALLVFVLSVAAMGVALAYIGKNGAANFASVVAALTFTLNYYGALGGNIQGPLDHLWSIAVEEHCYAILALLAVLLQRSQRSAMIVCTALGLAAMLNGAVLYYAGVGYVHEIYWRTDVRLAPVFLSAAAYLWSRQHQAPSSLPVALMVLSAPAYFLLEPLPLKMIVPTLMLVGAVNTLDEAPAWLRNALSVPVLTFIGTISYSLYLWQQPFYKATHGALWAILPAVVIAYFSYRFIENPARKWINRLSVGRSVRTDKDGFT